MACNESRTLRIRFTGLAAISPEGQIQINAWATHRAPTRNSRPETFRAERQYLRSYLLKANGSLKRMIARFAFPKMPH